MNIKTVVFFPILFLVLNAHAYEPIVNYKAQWGEGGNKRYETNIFIEYDKINVETIDLNKNKKIWSLSDKLSSCEFDPLIEVPINSFEVKDLFNDGSEVVFFAYKISCAGGEDPVDVKYFAYYKGSKFSLRGQSVNITIDGVVGKGNKPRPDYNLRENPKLLAYMLNKWPSVSTKILF
ncbi:hypothetical protein QVN60_03700 [Yersinia aleksiciae]|uniref:M949_RS01915 family surface polysaccharide biosynthesis protein n=1 Tax=Yersinia aleksiciae TaxID=263819 RepID=UPI0025AA8828|nr:hypothetical protein [Yersinia aleksiciae]MDN0122320.1 hypothetical protein [Yersinia aleksiciae]